MREHFHIGSISHDGSGTIITAIHLTRCLAPRYCTLCAQSIRTVPVTIADGDSRAAERAEGVVK